MISIRSLRPARLAAVLACGLGACGLGGSASGAGARGLPDSTLVTAREPLKILELAREIGEAELEADGLGDPLVEGRLNAAPYRVFFFGCDAENQRCDSLQFHALWSPGPARPDLEAVNRWNADGRSCKAYLGRDRGPRLEMDVNLRYGAPAGNLRADFQIWRDCLRAFSERLEAPPPPDPDPAPRRAPRPPGAAFDL